jgi:hypothetical protein
MRGLDGRGPRPAFTGAVLSALGVSADGDPADTCWSVIHAVQGLDPAGIARFAAPVLDVHDHDDTAAMLVGNAAAALFESLTALRPLPGSPVVLAGSLLTNHTALSHRLVRALADAGHQHVAFAVDGARGAARIALAADGVAPTSPAVTNPSR